MGSVGPAPPNQRAPPSTEDDARWRQLGYKHAKYIQRIQAVESLSDVYRGKGGYWEDSTDYQW